MFLNLLILIAAGVVLGAVFKFFIYDIVCLPINFLYGYFVRKGDRSKQVIASFGGAVILFLFFTYFFSGVCASFLSWAISKNNDSDFLKIVSLVSATGIPFALRSKAINMSAQDRFYIRVPSVIATLYYPYLVFIISVVIYISPSIMRFWNWMPFVN